VRFGCCFVTAKNVAAGKTLAQANAVQGNLSQFAGIAGQQTQLYTAGMQLANQLHRTGCWARRTGQFALMLQQPGMLGGGLVQGQSGQMVEDVLLQRNLQCPANGLEIVDGDSQGAVHVKHPVADLVQFHVRSSRRRIRPSWATEATNSPARLKIWPRLKPLALPLHGLSMAYRCHSSTFRLRWNHRE